MQDTTLETAEPRPEIVGAPEQTPSHETEVQPIGSANRQEIIETTNKHLEQAKDLGEISEDVFAILESLAQNNPERKQALLIDLLQQKGITDSEKVAKEFIRLDDSPLFNGLDVKANHVFERKPNEAEEAYQERIDKIAAETRKPFFELLANGKLTAKDINQFLAGGIRFALRPPSEIDHAVASVKVEDGQPQLSLYEDFFNEHNKGREHIIYHELGHVIAAQVFKGEIDALKKIASTPAAPVDSLPQYLQMVVAMVRNPGAAMEREHRGEGSHLHRELRKLQKAYEEQDPGAGARAQQMVDEILADRVANYLESDGTKESYAALRFSGVAAKFKDNDLHFSSETAMFEAINQGLAQKDSWHFDQTEQDIFWDGDIYYENIEPERRTPLLSQSVSQTASNPGNSSAFGQFIDWLTGSKKVA